MKLHTTQNVVRTNIYMLSIFIFVCTTGVANALVSYEPMTKIPGLGEGGDIVEFINTAYTVLIAVGAMFGVIKIAYAGFKYSLSEVVSKKGEALDEIQGVFVGLAVLLMPFIVLNTIYSPLTNLDILKSNLTPVVHDVPETQIQDRTRFIPKEGEAHYVCTYSDGTILAKFRNTKSSDECAKEMNLCTRPIEEGGRGGRHEVDLANQKTICIYSVTLTTTTYDIKESYEAGTARLACTSLDGEVTDIDYEKGIMTCTHPTEANYKP